VLALNIHTHSYNQMCILFAHIYPIVVPSEPPQSPSGVAHSPTLVTLTWSSPSPIDINGNLQYYVVKMTEVESSRYWIFFALDSFIRIGALHPYYHCRNQVAAHTIDTGPFTDPFYVQTQESGMYKQ